MDEDKENRHPGFSGKVSPFNVVARRSEIFERLFSKSSEISSLTSEMFSITNNLKTRESFVK